MRKVKLLWILVPLIVIWLCFGPVKIFGLISSTTFIQKIANTILTILTLFITWSLSLAPHLKKIKTGLDFFESVRSKVANVRRGWHEAKHKEIADLEIQKTMTVNEINTLEAEKSEVQQKQLQLEDRLEQLMQGRGLEEFLLSRSGSADYQEQLGIIALVHQDMKELQRKLQAGLKVDVDGKEETRRYDRVILYIDDLDRCSPERVVEVLQAVHLLLSIPLFVVVVAADPRWLLQCLLTYYKDLHHERLKMEESEWAITPQNYMEKIFQIPYTLPSMANRDFPKYVADLFSQEGSAHDSDEVEAKYHELQNEVEYLEIKTRRLQQRLPADKAQPDIAGTESSQDIEETPTLPTKATDWQKEQEKLLEAKERLQDASRKVREKMQQSSAILPTFDNNPKTLNVSAKEKEFVTLLLPLLNTPRSTKRLLNVYRLIRVSLTPNEIEAFEREEHQAVLVLLAVMYNYPKIAVEFFTDLRNSGENTLREYCRQKLDENNNNVDWHRLNRGINKVDGMQDISVYRRWLDIVGRFSFQVGYELSREQG